jgi:2-keto-3-deoxy-L-rhamnonate aldolase RhmA
VMLETTEGIENCKAIAAVDGIDVQLIGSGDSTTDLGTPGQVDHPRLRAAYDRVAAACRTHRQALGVGAFATTRCRRVN